MLHQFVAEINIFINASAADAYRKINDPAADMARKMTIN